MDLDNFLLFETFTFEVFTSIIIEAFLLRFFILFVLTNIEAKVVVFTGCLAKVICFFCALFCALLKVGQTQSTA